MPAEKALVFRAIGDFIQIQIGDPLATVGAGRGCSHIYATNLCHTGAFANKTQNPEPVKR